MGICLRSSIGINMKTIYKIIAGVGAAFLLSIAIGNLANSSEPGDLVKISTWCTNMGSMDRVSNAAKISKDKANEAFNMEVAAGNCSITEAIYVTPNKRMYSYVDKFDRVMQVWKVDVLDQDALNIGVWSITGQAYAWETLGKSEGI